MRAHLLRHDLLHDGRTPLCGDETPGLMTRANELHVRDELRKLREEGIITRYDEKTMPACKLPDSIAIASSQTCTFPNHATLIIVTDSEAKKMYEAVKRLGPRAHGKRVGTVHFNGQLFSVKYNLTNDVLEAPAVKGSGPGAFVISQSHKKNMNTKNINLSYTSKCIER